MLHSARSIDSQQLTELLRDINQSLDLLWFWIPQEPDCWLTCDLLADGVTWVIECRRHSHANIFTKQTRDPLGWLAKYAVMLNGRIWDYINQE
jgi:hypothetical protein